MIYVTGDMHGDADKLKLACAKLKKGDTLIICGDFGFLWEGSRHELKTLKKLGKARYNLCFIEGCNENFELLSTYPETEFKSGKARNISGRLWQLCRGEVYSMEDKRIFVFGGGESEDIESKRAQGRWFPEELPSLAEMERGVDNLEKQHFEVDAILTYQPPGLVLAMLENRTLECDSLQFYLSEIAKRTKFGCWYFGRLHRDRTLTPLYTAVFSQVLALNPPDKKKKKAAEKAEKGTKTAVQ